MDNNGSLITFLPMIIREGENCWLNTRADRASFLIDAADYFEAFARAARQARQTIYIAGWDFDSRLVLDRRGKITPGLPALGKFLNQAVKRNPALEIYVLTWDFHLIYLRERQLWPLVQFGWKSHRRIHFRLDDHHPVGASQHQKFVVIDDSIAFCGGVDLTTNRWDTQAHRAEDERRRDINDVHYKPFHDIQMTVSGEAARALGRLFRCRWQRAVGEVPRAPGERTRASWPAPLPVDIEGCSVAVVRTLPAFQGQQGIREIERFYLDAIGSASRLIYIENQYLTATAICRHLGHRLADPQGPEIVIVMPSKADGWLEQSTMDAIRRRNLESLFQKDRHGRLAVFYPSVGQKAMPIYVHAKVLIVDDRLALVGSANLSNRSMGFDSECCLAIEADSDDRVAAGIGRFRNRLLAEHLGVSVQEVASACHREGSLIRVIRRLGHSDRTLKPLDMEAAPVVDGTAWVPDRSFLDPEEPFAFDQVIDRFAQDSKPRAGAAQVLKVLSIVVILLGLAAIWRWTPTSEWMTADRLAQWAGLLKNTPLLITVVIASYVAGGLIFVPVTLLIVATTLILPVWQSFLCAMSGCVLSAWASYWIGRGLGRSTVQRVTGKRLERLNKYLSHRGILAVIVVRNLPVAPFTIVNIAAGTTPIRQSHFLIGTAVGMLPGILAVTVFTGRVLQVLKSPTWTNVLVAAAVAVVLGIGLWWMRRRIKARVPGS